MSPKKPLMIMIAGLIGSSITSAQDTVVLSDSFDYPNGTIKASGELPWEIKLPHSRMTGIKSGELILNQGGKRVLLFAPVQTGQANVTVEFDAAAKNKKSPNSPRFDLKASIDGSDWITLKTIEGPFETTTIQESFSTTENFQLRIDARGWTYAQTVTLDNLKVSIDVVDTENVSVSNPVWIEDFEGLRYKATSDTGETAWEESSERRSYSGIVRNRFHLAPRRSIATWETEEIDISTFKSVAINAQVDYKKRVNSRLEASIDGGEWLPIWSDQESGLKYTKTPTLVGNLSGESLKLRFFADKWTTIRLHSVDVYGLGTSEAPTPDPITPPPSALAQFSAVKNVSDIWHLDASTSNAASYLWLLDGIPISEEAIFDLPSIPFPVQITLQVVNQNGEQGSVSHTLNTSVIQNTELQMLEDTTILSWLTSAMGFSQIEMANEEGAFTSIGDPIPGTGFGAHFVSSLPYEIRIAEALHFGGFDYSDENLNHLDMGGTDAANANFANVNGRLVYLDHSNLAHSNWEGANLTFAELHDADLSNARMINAKFIDCVFDRANLSNADLGASDFTNSDFRGADLSNANLANANLTSTDLRGANLDGANLSGATLTNALRD